MSSIITDLTGLMAPSGMQTYNGCGVSCEITYRNSPSIRVFINNDNKSFGPIKEMKDKVTLITSA